MHRRAVLLACVTGCGLLCAAGCGGPDANLVSCVNSGEFGRARALLEERLAGRGCRPRSDRNYVLDRMRLMIVALADGYPATLDATADDLFETLTLQGLNKDRTVPSIVINERVKIWKGEPFEQALAFHYLALYHAMRGSWDNARAAIGNSMFHLRDFGSDAKGKRLEGLALARKAAQAEKRRGKAKTDYLQTGYNPVDSDFTLGYLMTAVWNQQLAKATGDSNRQAEADENFAKALVLDGGLRELIGELKQADYNTLLLVDYGRGPQKIGTGPDKAIAKFVPLMGRDRAALTVTAGGTTGSYPVVCDLNTMARDHMWNNLEDVRIAKSIIGTGMMVAGAAVAARGGRNQAAAGLTLMFVGLAVKASAHADVRYCEVVPQRIYVVPLRLERADTPIALALDRPGGLRTRLVLRGCGAGGGKGTQVRYVRMPGEACVSTWTRSGKIYYHNDACAADDAGRPLPYILGGRCVCAPRPGVLRRYQQAGFLKNMTVTELEELYRLEGIDIDTSTQGKLIGKHVLEGGNSLVLPVPGSAGFARLLGQIHPPYRPRSQRVRQLSASIRASLPRPPPKGTAAPGGKKRKTPRIDNVTVPFSEAGS